MKFLATAFVLLAAVAMLVQASPMLGPPGRHVFPVIPHDPEVSPPFEKFLQDHTTAVKKLNGTIKALKKGLEKHEKKIFETSINDIYGAAYNVEKVAKEFVDKVNRDYKVEPIYRVQPIEN
ncbi:7392_t:CDS:2 [Cetraspora pellucida]|uniref:7392_t:CDS:1 n=1 Tax=Cetraspora pellucida TaxID=1433469 RepID=A0A9N9ERZ8_9GLOM|nr:7392_t:CDS:2 [Cetraspora pellucida]